ncbi:hypothetical protein CF319_g3898 [Tilletia indica]|nr:hypothetical protein CF319_g3898 [Tilletia indica]
MMSTEHTETTPKAKKRTTMAASSEAPVAKKPSKPDCVLREITQYDCDIRVNKGIRCFPARRIFRICEGRPAVEVTHVVEWDSNDKPILKPEFQTAMPPSSHWSAS